MAASKSGAHTSSVRHHRTGEEQRSKEHEAPKPVRDEDGRRRGRLQWYAARRVEGCAQERRRGTLRPDPRQFSSCGQGRLVICQALAPKISLILKRPLCRSLLISCGTNTRISNMERIPDPFRDHVLSANHSPATQGSKESSTRSDLSTSSMARSKSANSALLRGFSSTSRKKGKRAA